jgi:hypothetical protein
MAEETLRIIQNGRYELGGKQVHIGADIQAMKDGTVYYPHEHEGFDAREAVLGPHETKFEVFNETTFDGVRALMEEGKEKITCLNFASAKNPGGGFLNGSQAQAARQQGNHGEDKIERVMLERIYRVCKVAHQHGCEHFLLGAWGCGVFQQNPVNMAKWMKEVLTTYFVGVFKTLRFSVLDRSNGETFEAFEREFAKL